MAREFPKKRMHPRRCQRKIPQQTLPFPGRHGAFQVCHPRRSNILPAQMPERLHQQTAEASRRRHVAGRGPAQSDLLPPDLHDARGAIRQENHPGGNLFRQAEQIRRVGAGWLHPNAGFPGQCLGHLLDVWRQDAQFWMSAGILIKPSGKAAENLPVDQTMQGDVYGAPAAEVKEITGSE